LSSRDYEGIWLCPDCRQENVPLSRFCEVCGKQRGSVEPGPGPAVMARLRGARASSDPQGALPGNEVGDTGGRVKLRFLDFRERLRAMFRRATDAGGKGEGGNPTFAIVVASALWAFIRLVGYLPLMLLLKFIAFLFTPLGLPVWLLFAWYYGRNRRAIHRGLDTLRRQVRGFVGMAAKVLDSLNLLRGGMQNLLQRARGDDMGASRGTALRILEDEWDDEDDEPPAPRRRPR